MDQRPISARPLLAAFLVYVPVTLVWLIFAMAVTLSRGGQGAAGAGLAIYMWLFFPLIAASAVMTNKAYRKDQRVPAIVWSSLPAVWVMPMLGYLLLL
jgi:hypothetical protein